MFSFRNAILVLIVLLSSPWVQAAEVAGVKLDDKVKAGSQELVLNGAGLRKKLFFKVYVAALYVPLKSTEANVLTDTKEPRRVELHLLRDLDADSLVGALKDGLRQNLKEAELTALKEDVERFSALMRSIGNGKSGDVIALDLAADGAAVSANSQARGKVDSRNLGTALLKIWLGDKPVDTDLKQALLGG